MGESSVVTASQKRYDSPDKGTLFWFWFITFSQVEVPCPVCLVKLNSVRQG